jgi:hypothetical protein
MTAILHRIRLLSALSFLSEIVFWAGTLYCGLRDVLPFRLSHLLHGVFTPTASHNVLLIAYGVSGCHNFFTLIVKPRFQKKDRSSLAPMNPNGFIQCFKKANSEILGHLNTLNDSAFNVRDFQALHKYEVNIGFVLLQLWLYLVDSFKDKGAIGKDFFLSFYHNPQMVSYLQNPHDNQLRKTLEYVVHYEPSWEVQTQQIDLTSHDFGGYACTVGYLTGRKAFLDKVTRKNYIKGAVPRRETVVQYLGIPLKVGSHPIAWLNIEIHNKALFGNKLAIEQFYNAHLLAFEALLEYQLLKRIFFTHVSQRIQS